MNHSIVVVEDERDILELLRDMLELHGYHVVAVGRPDLVPDVSLVDDPALILVDLMLPGMSGIELAEQLRSRGFAETPMVAMSASTLLLRVASESHLFQETLAKPFDLSTVMDCVGRYTAQKCA